MKFTNGFWMVKDEFKADYVRDLLDVEETEDEVRFYGPYQKINGRGDTLNVGLMNNMELTATSDKELSVIFKATATGEQFIGFHFKTPDDGYSNRLYLKSVVVEVTADQSVPGCVTNLTATPGAQGALQADVALPLLLCLSMGET